MGEALGILRCAILIPLLSCGCRTVDPHRPPRIPGCAFLEKNAQDRFEYRHARTGVVLVLIPGGTFLMGSAEGEEGRDPAEGPRHEVSVRSFLIGKYEVTQAQWEAIMRHNPSKFKGDDRPVECVDWDDCQEFCRRTRFSLPSEAEWEYACRAGTATPFNCGESLSPGQANCRGSHSGGGAREGAPLESTAPVGSHKPNGFGLFDMHGNVWEWCADAWHDSYDRAPADQEAWVADGEDARVLRGGSWDSGAEHCRSACRSRSIPSYRLASDGLRVVLHALLP